MKFAAKHQSVAVSPRYASFTEKRSPAMRLPRCVGECLRLLRLARHLSQDELARRTRRPRGEISGIESGTIRPSLATVRVLLGAMGFSTAELRLAQAILEKRFE
jgi:predicted transcriptional regulator